MKKKSALLCIGVLVSVVMLFLVGCGSQETSTIEPDISFEENLLSVTVEENATTGYMWEYEISGTSIELLNESFVPAEGDEAGAPGTHTFLFIGLSEGQSTIEFTYSQSFDPQPNDEKFSVEVNAAADGTIEDAQKI